MPRGNALLALALLAPALAGCTFLNPPPQSPVVDARVVQEAFAVPELDLSLDHAFGNVRARGPALAVALRSGGQEFGAVYVGAAVSWRADALFQARGREVEEGDLFVEAPAGAWEALRAGQGWRAALPEDLARAGLEGPRDLFLRASRTLPQNHAPPLPDLWVLNGTIAARVEPTNFTLASLEGPFVFQRNATGFIVVEGRTLVAWSELNRSLDAQNDAILRARVENASLAELRVTWTAGSVAAELLTPAFRRADLNVTEDPGTRTIGVVYPGVAEVAMLRYASRELRDGLVELRSQNMTLRMAPG